ncbi:MRE11 [Hepatospora eriocheir]|uniref:MRE11 n=1 Tax=Hepatospora eriocheir TaxID=1081669 RepID=A0A1X0QEM8_9MICR|nr:MRE11 [Hepatospora eriocheir]
MKILITSDNHLGYNETDIIRGDDSFNTFQEILKQANDENVDFILQGGDLFHYNKPSRNTYNKTVNLLTENCLGENSLVIFKNTQEPNRSFQTNVFLNKDQQDVNIRMPIISIHGNHDDPSGHNSVSPLDILNSAKFINYVGKVETSDEIIIKPILIEKSGVKIALYPLGYIKDRRLYRMFTKNKVIFDRPDSDEYYNILIVHQNRVFRNEEYLPLEFIPEWFNLAIYGHEHASIKLTEKNLDVIQVGSSIRTSLSLDETGAKYSYLLEFIDSEWKITRKELKTVRSFILDAIKITGSNIEDQIKEKLNLMLSKIQREKNNDLLPLIRLKVEMDNEKNLNRYSLKAFVEDKIANPNDFIRITRKVDKKSDATVSVSKTITMNDIFLKMLQRENLVTLKETKIVDALNEFINRSNKNSFTQILQESKTKLFEKINVKDLVSDEIENLIKEISSKLFNDDVQIKKLKLTE